MGVSEKGELCELTSVEVSEFSFYQCCPFLKAVPFSRLSLNAQCVYVVFSGLRYPWVRGDGNLPLGGYCIPLENMEWSHPFRALAGLWVSML